MSTKFSIEIIFSFNQISVAELRKSVLKQKY